MKKKTLSDPRRITIDGMTCVVGRTPASGYTVGGLIDRLKGFPMNTPIGFTTSVDTNYEVLSIYPTAEKPDVVWIDLGQPE